jgi:hypothetical protein
VPAPALAHAGDQSFVLLLPTGYYSAGGVAVVALTVLFLALLPPAPLARAFHPRTIVPAALPARARGGLRAATSLAACALLFTLILIGLNGPQVPTKNALSLGIWTLLWIGLVLLQGLAGDLWRWLNPWTGLIAVARAAGLRPPLHLPARAGHWPALGGLFLVTAWLLIDPAPANPARLAIAALGWWAMHLALALIFGPRWIFRGEPLTVLFAAHARLAPLARQGGRWRIGLPGWQVASRPRTSLALALFITAMLAWGSFDGLYETFWWLALVGQNPLEFEGRSAVTLVNLAGLAAALPLLALTCAACLALGRAGTTAPPTAMLFRVLAPALLPIAFVYHASHYLPALLVDGQHTMLALNDPFARGDDWLGLQGMQVTTGFFNRLPSVRLIWLAQAGLIVAGHVAGLLLSHAIALRLLPDSRAAFRLQLPFAAFMVAYTLFGLWLLATPRGA